MNGTSVNPCGYCCSVAQSYLTLSDAMNCSTPCFPVLHYLPEFAQVHVHWIVMPSNCLILYCLLFLLPSIFPGIKVFSNESALCIRWSKFWSFSFNISPSNEYSGWFPLGLTVLISFFPHTWYFLNLFFFVFT